MVLMLSTATPLLADDGSSLIWLEQERQRLLLELENLRLQRELEDTGAGNIQLVTPQNITLEAGEVLETTITVRNVGSRAVQNLVTLASPDADAPFSVEFLRNTNSVSQVNTNAQRNMTLQITVNDNAEAGNHEIALSHFFSSAAGTTSTSTDTINVRIGGITGTPNVRLGDFQTMHTGSLSPGQTFTVSANIQNSGSAAAQNVRVILPNNERADDDIFLTSDLNQAIFQTMAANHSSTLNFTFEVSPDVASGTHTIEFHVLYADESGREFPAANSPAIRFFFHVNVYAPDGDDEVPNLEIRNMSAPVGTINVGQDGRITFYLFNSGELDARNIRVEATVPGDDGRSIVPMTSNIQVIPSLAPGDSRQVSFTFSPRDTAQTRSYAIQFRTTFEIGRTGETETFDQFAAFNVYNPEAEDEDGRAQIPRVIVSEHFIYPSPRAGQEFDMTITFRNTNASRSVNNIRILLEENMATNIPGQQHHFAGLAPLGGSNTLFIEHLPAQGEVTKNLTFTTSPDATPGMHNMRISFDYQDDEFQAHEDSVQISFPLTQIMRLEITNVNVPDFASAGNPARFSFRIINTGRVNLSNMNVRTEGPFDVSEAGRFITPINAQRFVEFDGQFVPLEAGVHQGFFIVSGEDNMGEMIEVEYPFTIMVDEGWGEMGGDWDGAWSGEIWVDDGMMMHRPMPEDSAPSGIMSRIFGSIFTREIAPEWWDEEFMGEFNETNAAMMGVTPETETRIVAVIGATLLVAAAIAIPVIIIISKKKNKINFDDDDLD